MKLAGVIAGMRTIVTKNSGEQMASLVLEDFTGQASMVAFPKTYEKLREVLVKDTVVQVTGYTMMREMRGEKSIEVRIDDVTPLEPTLQLSFKGESNAEGLVEITLRRATPQQLAALKQVIDGHPGSYEVQVRIVSDDGTTPIDMVQHVQPSDIFLAQLRSSVRASDVKVNDWIRGALR